MSTHKTQFTDKAAEDFLNSYFNTKGIKVESIKGGAESQAFYFSLLGEKYVLRVTKHGMLNYLKDSIAYSDFSSEKLPVSEIIDCGEFGKGFSFAVMKRAAGKTLDRFSKEQLGDLAPKVAAAIAEVHKIEVPGEGYGGWGSNRNGSFKSWNEYLLANLAQEGFEDRSFCDADFNLSLKREILKLVPFCPEERVVLHGDCAPANILSDGKRVTALIDWGDSLYGDPLHDVACIDFWASKNDFTAVFRDYYLDNGGLPDNFEERIMCYKLLRAYGSLWFYAYSDQEDSYKKCAQNAKEILQSLNS
jgi:hygromycin-B 4-O-kinase